MKIRFHDKLMYTYTTKNVLTQYNIAKAYGASNIIKAEKNSFHHLHQEYAKYGTQNQAKLP